MKKKKIIIGTHNTENLKKSVFYCKKNIKKISPKSLKIKSPKETGNTF